MQSLFPNEDLYYMRPNIPSEPLETESAKKRKKKSPKL